MAWSLGVLLMLSLSLDTVVGVDSSVDATTNLNMSSCATLGHHLKMPSIGLGTYLLSNVSDAITSAFNLPAGYRRIDCAPVYFNEDAIGDALQKLFQSDTINLKREDLYISSKLASPFHRHEHVEIALRKTLTDLRLDYLDLYLIHWPVSFKYVEIDPTTRGWNDESIDDSDDGKNIDPSVSVKETWKGMEALVDKGLVREIGVSNFPVALLHELLSECRIPPAVNQVELHPYLQQTNLLRYCNKRGVHVQAYSPLGTPGYKEENEPNVLHDQVLNDVATKKGVTVAQVCLAWALQRGTSVVVKSSSRNRQKENLEAANIELTSEEMERINMLDRHYRFFRPEDWWGSLAMAVFD